MNIIATIGSRSSVLISRGRCHKTDKMMAMSALCTVQSDGQVLPGRSVVYLSLLYLAHDSE